MIKWCQDCINNGIVAYIRICFAPALGVPRGCRPNPKLHNIKLHTHTLVRSFALCVTIKDTKDSYIKSEDKLVVSIGLKNIIVVNKRFLISRNLFSSTFYISYVPTSK